MRKQIISTIIALITLFCIIGLSACNSYNNEGRIRGLDEANFNARFYRPSLEYYGIEKDVVLVSNMEELNIWQEKVIWEHRRKVNDLDFEGFPYDPSERLIQSFNSFIFCITENHLENFFETRQLIIIPMLRSSSSRRFEVRRISYNNSTLSIDLRKNRPRGQWYSDISISFGIIEITSISQNINLDLNIFE